MVKKAFTLKQIINKLREAEILLNKGATVGEVSKKIGVTEQTYYCWRREYGGMRVEQARRLKELEKENSQRGGDYGLMMALVSGYGLSIRIMSGAVIL